VDLKNEADSAVHNTEKALSEHKAKLQPSDIEEIEREINGLRAILTEQLTLNDISRLKENVEKCKNAAMKIGKVMYQGSASSAGPSSEQAEQQSQSHQNPEGEKKSEDSHNQSANKDAK